MDAWAGDIPAQQLQQAPGGFIDWAIWLLQQMVTLNVAWCLFALVVGMLWAIGATEFCKRFDQLISGPAWALRAQLLAALWGTVVTTLLILALPDWPLRGRVVAAICVAPLAAFYANRVYDVLRRLFPLFMDAVMRRLRGDPAPPS